MIDPEMRVQIRRYFYAEHWKIGTIARRWTFIPIPCGAPSRWNDFIAPSRCGPRWWILICRLCARRWSSIRACAPRAFTRCSEDRGYTGSVEQLRRVVARLRPQPQEAFLRLHVFAGEQAQVDWASFRHGHGGPRQARAVLLRDDLVLVAGAVSGVLLRSDDGELPARPCARLRSRSMVQPESCSTTISKGPCWSAAAIRSISTRDCWSWPVITTSSRVLVRCGREIKKGAWKGRFGMCAIRSGRHATFTTLEECNRQALKWRDEVAHQRPGPTIASHRRRGFRRRAAAPAAAAARTSSPPIAWLRCARPRPSTCVSTATTTRSRPRRWAAN